MPIDEIPRNECGTGAGWDFFFSNLSSYENRHGCHPSSRLSHGGMVPYMNPFSTVNSIGKGLVQANRNHEANYQSRTSILFARLRLGGDQGAYV